LGGSAVAAAKIAGAAAKAADNAADDGASTADAPLNISRFIIMPSILLQQWNRRRRGKVP